MVNRVIGALFVALGLLVCSACGQVSTTPFGAAPGATPPPEASASPSSTSGVTLPADATVRTADEAAQIALSQAPALFYAKHPHVASVQLVIPLDLPVPSDRYVPAKKGNDPARMSWLVKLDQGGYSMEACPPPPPGVDQTTCWTSPTATMTISVMSGKVGMVSAPYPRDQGTPYPPSQTVTMPATAKLKTRQDAMAIGFGYVPGKDGQRPTVINVRLLSLPEWLAEQDQRGYRPNVDALDPATPVWELEFSDASDPVPCLSTRPTGCALEHVFLSLNALTGDSMGVFGWPPPLSTAPSATP